MAFAGTGLPVKIAIICLFTKFGGQNLNGEKPLKNCASSEIYFGEVAGIFKKI